MSRIPLREHRVSKEDESFREHRQKLLSDLDEACTSTTAAGDRLQTNANSHIHTFNSPEWFDKHQNWLPQLRRWHRISDELPLISSNCFSLDPLDELDALGLASGYSIFDHFDRRFQLLQDRMKKSANDFSMQCAESRESQKDSLCELRHFSDIYEPGRDGHLYFKTRFDVTGFNPDEVRVSTDARNLVVHCEKCEASPDGGTHSREYYRSIIIPESVNMGKMHAKLTRDGMLLVEASIKEPDYGIIKFDKNRRICIAPKSSEDIPLAMKPTILGKNEPTIIEMEDGKKILHFELVVPENFTTADITVRFDVKKIIVTGKHRSSRDEKTPECGFHEQREDNFSREFVIPHTLDPCSVCAMLEGRNLVVEAPLIKL